MEKIEKYCHALRLGGILKHWQKIFFDDKEKFLAELLELEFQERESNRINRLIKNADFRVLKTLEDFQWNKNIELPASLTRESLENLDFISAKENLLFVGAVGTGKTHLATALALKACKVNHSVRFFTAAQLSNILMEKNKTGRLHSFFSSLKKVELIVLDEIGFIPIHKEASQLLFQVISDCYEQKSLIVTSNLEFSQWNSVFGDDKLTTALLDRLIHHSHIAVFSGESFRLKQSMNRQKFNDSKS